MSLWLWILIGVLSAILLFILAVGIWGIVESIKALRVFDKSAREWALKMESKKKDDADEL